jgi:hypothetical protein
MRTGHDGKPAYEPHESPTPWREGDAAEMARMHSSECRCTCCRLSRLEGTADRLERREGEAAALALADVAQIAFTEAGDAEAALARIRLRLSADLKKPRPETVRSSMVRSSMVRSSMVRSSMVRSNDEGVVWQGLVKLLEEVSELGVEAAKLMAYPSGEHPDGKGPLVPRLLAEMADVSAIIAWFCGRHAIGFDPGRVQRKLGLYSTWDESSRLSGPVGSRTAYEMACRLAMQPRFDECTSESEP